MKKIIFALGTIALLVSCNGKNEHADAYGNFESDEVIISAENNGKIIETNTTEGDVVSEGALLAITDTANLSLQIGQLEAQRASIEAQKATIAAQIEINNQQISNINKDLARISKMIKDGAATQKQLDDVNGQIALAQKQKAASQSQLNAIDKQADAMSAQINVLKDRLNSSYIKAPINGTILEKYIEKGELAVPGKALYKMADLETLTLKVYVSETQLPSIKIGNEVSVQIDNGSELKEMKGKISWVSAQAEFTPKTIQTKEERVKLVYAVKVRVKNDGSLKIGMPGEILFN